MRHGSSLPGPRHPHQARGEVALGGAGVAALHDGDPLAAGALVGDRGARSHRELNFDRRADRHHVPGAHRVVVAEVAAARVRVGRRVLHLPQGVDRIGAHREQRRARAVVEVQVVELRALALVDEHPQRRVERLLTWTTDPEEAVALLVHADEAFLQASRPHHDVVHADE
jgi:hypothetical protein